jgi:hypothetical protein
LSPGRRTNRKNLRNCQRTILVLLLLKFSSIKKLHPQDAYFQSSAARPQAGDRILCRAEGDFAQKARGSGVLHDWGAGGLGEKIFAGAEGL